MLFMFLKRFLQRLQNNNIGNKFDVFDFNKKLFQLSFSTLTAITSIFNSLNNKKLK